MHSIRIPFTGIVLMALLLSAHTVTGQDLDETGGSGSDATASESKQEGAGHEASGHPPGPANRLAKESSPYLLQHAHNPVDWYPWGEEAFAKAKRENKLIFLSVGYAACHWCHVMERESFVDPEIAQKLNENFVCIKVDREERPDVDQIYMTAVQILNRNGGWPMSVFLLPDARPFWGGTYFPARDGDRGQSTGFLTIIDQIQDAWSTRKDEVVRQSSMLTEAIAANQASEVDERPFDEGLINAAVDSLLEQYDPIHGGFGSPEGGPKFPEPSNLVFLLDRWQRESVNEAQRESAKRILLKSLNGMISGAMYDHLGGGFHRYSVDERWQIPHFEKMLYDNGQLVSVYAEAYERTGNEEFRYVVESTCDFVLRELTSENGAFFSALDADSEGEEGKFYRWTEDELVGFQTVDGYRDFARIFRFNDKPNFEQEFYVPDPGKALMRIAEQDEVEFETLLTKLEPTRLAMLSKRDERERPITDTKILTAWNGLMITGLADAGRILDRNDYKSAAVKATRFLLKELKADDGRLYRSHAAGEAKLNGYIDDYAFLVNALISLHRAMKDARLLTLAADLTDKQIELFWDERQGGFFFTSSDHPKLIVRVKDPVDSAVPSGVGVSAQNLIYLAEHAGREDYRDRLRSTLQSLTPTLRRAPFASPRATSVMAAFLDSETQP